MIFKKSERKSVFCCQLSVCLCVLMYNLQNMYSEFIKSPDKEEKLLKKFNNERMVPGDDFSNVYSSYSDDMGRVEQLEEVYGGQESRLGKVAEALVYSVLKRHEVAQNLAFRPASTYDDFFHGTDVLVEQRNGSVKAFATIDITINQSDIKGNERKLDKDPRIVEARPVGLEGKLIRSRRYTDYLSNYDPGDARNLSGWLESGGLSETANDRNRRFFTEAEKLFLLKYFYRADNSTDTEKPGYIIGGPQAIISIDTAFINKALQGSRSDEDIVSDLSVLEFVFCLQKEQAYLDKKITSNSARNLFFDSHYAKVKAWSHIMEKEDFREMINNLFIKNKNNQDFMEQLRYYIRISNKVFGE